MKISIAMQKGGVGKTTTAWGLASCLSEIGKKVLVIDFDPQGSLTKCVGINPKDVKKHMVNAILGEIDINETILRLPKFGFIPSSIRLSKAELEIASRIGKEFILENMICDIQEKYDYVIIDTPPNLGHLTVNALTASDMVVVPLQCEYLAYEGLDDLKGTIAVLEKLKRLKINCLILPTMYDGRTKHAKEILEQAIKDSEQGYQVFNHPIKKTIKFSDCAVEALDIIDFIKVHPGEDVLTDGVEAYRELAKYIVKGDF